MYKNRGFTFFRRKKDKPLLQYKNSGFTLVELMVAVTIVAILSTIGLVYYGDFVKNSRDTKRQADLKSIQSALEDYHADSLNYPFALADPLVSADGTKTYLTKLPSDPIATNPNYAYVPAGTGCTSSAPVNCTSYCLWAQLEKVTLNSDPVCTSPPTGFSAPGAYGVTRP